MSNIFVGKPTGILKQMTLKITFVRKVERTKICDDYSLKCVARQNKISKIHEFFFFTFGMDI